MNYLQRQYDQVCSRVVALHEPTASPSQPRVSSQPGVNHKSSQFFFVSKNKNYIVGNKILGYQEHTLITGSARSRLRRNLVVLRDIYPEDTLFAHCRLSRYDCLIQILSDMNLVDYLLTQRNAERYYKTFVSRERVASFLNFVHVDLEITKTLFVFSTAVLIVDSEIS